MKTCITFCGLQSTLQRLIALNDNKKYVRKNIEIPIHTELSKWIYLSVTDFVGGQRKGYYVIVSFKQCECNDETETMSNNDFSALMNNFFVGYPCFMINKECFIICNIDENCCYYYDEKKSAINDIKSLIDTATSLTLCECKKNFIFDDGSICLQCNLGLLPYNNKEHFCVICQQINFCKVIILKCCNNYIHISCLNKFTNYSDRCPLCRKSLSF